MVDLLSLNRTHHFIMNTFVKTGHAPHYTEISREFKIQPDSGKNLLHELMNAKLGAMWLHPHTDFIVTFSPFSNLPTQYRISVDGQQKWFTP
ncbi:MAG: hypothetical protein VR64_15195 [Desulfatitalea sp. BRH_c12]|nr:MAG: hypothetical protein VR64_15195 [Desulfatitalea sp. BRH_c12]